MTRGRERRFSLNPAEAADRLYDAGRALRSFIGGVVTKNRDPATAMEREHRMGTQLYSRLEELVSPGVEVALIYRKNPDQDRSTGDKVLDKITGKTRPYNTTVVLPQLGESNDMQSFLIIHGSNEKTPDDGDISRYTESVTRVYPNGVTRRKTYSNITNYKGDGTTYEQAINGQPVVPADEASLETLLEAVSGGGGGVEIMTDPEVVARYSTLNLNNRRIAYGAIDIDTRMTWQNFLEL